jgi:hypothetical protein
LKNLWKRRETLLLLKQAARQTARRRPVEFGARVESVWNEMKKRYAARHGKKIPLTLRRGEAAVVIRRDIVAQRASGEKQHGGAIVIQTAEMRQFVRVVTPNDLSLSARGQTKRRSQIADGGSKK